MLGFSTLQISDAWFVLAAAPLLGGYSHV
jgi:hypothetical protein